ncbi:MAG: hypothetical protein ACLR4D_00895 [Faecalibacterium sp.]
MNLAAGKADCTRALPRQIDAAAKWAGLARGEYTIRITAHAGHAREFANAAAHRPGRQGSSSASIQQAAMAPSMKLTGVYGFENAVVGCLPGGGNDFLRTFGTKAEFLIWTPSLQAAGRH